LFPTNIISFSFPISLRRDNRGNLHANAHRGSGGVGAFLKNELFDVCDITTQDKSVDDILWIKDLGLISSTPSMKSE
jgi:hypothetical protein